MVAHRRSLQAGSVAQPGRERPDPASWPSAAGVRCEAWYDEVDSISQAIRREPGDRALRRARWALLEQAGLNEVAAYDHAVSR